MSGWAQAARLAYGYVQVRQGKYQVMWPGAAQARASGRTACPNATTWIAVGFPAHPPVAFGYAMALS